MNWDVLKRFEILWNVLKYLDIQYYALRFIEMHWHALKWLKMHWDALKWLKIHWDAFQEQVQLTAQSAHACRNLTQASASRFLQNAKTNTKIKTETDKQKYDNTQCTVTSNINQKDTRTNSFGLQNMFLENKKIQMQIRR